MLNIYLGKDNLIELQLISGKSAANLDNIEKIVIKINDIEIDSSDVENETGNYVTWTSGVPNFNQGNLFLKLGNHPDLQELDGIHEMRLTTYDVYYPNGLVWVDEEPINFIQE